MQLPLAVTLPDDETFASFVPGANDEVYTLLSCIAGHSPDWRGEPALALLDAASIPLINVTGPSGRGKSHLLYATCHQLAAREIPHAYVNFADVLGLSPKLLDALEQLPVICLDNLDAITGDAHWEEAVFDLINRVSETRIGLLIIAAQANPNAIEVELPDLRSRLSAGLTYAMASLTDEQRGEILTARAQQRGLVLSAQALHYLLNHSQRDLPSLMALLDRLDQRSLQEQKKISVALVKRELAEDPDASH
ncbi:DnaA regulatory inactivator Hda [Alteromonas lipolytica]|uniref:DnaA regulatory inactivator Hda n=1 Tax=Alteromonas lipolytica TaxID=1856405 RepID=A0A1E8FHR7_9ALTE|nr:DnaA regulatory inactivator Hda [Alteromonas lipolytica]OFI35286.1 DnaA regulatory inactivator Hda [Alteromonas lipolytica]GGF58304.1 DnaA regulatory inactivator Hda [Alteromonas lipolytica]